MSQPATSAAQPSPGPQQDELRLLGQPRLWLGGVLQPLSSRRLSLLAHLALDGPTPRAELAELLWPGVQGDARNNLRVELSRLRQTPLAAHLRGEDRLALHGVGVDALMLLEAVGRGDFTLALQWSGAPLAGLEGLPGSALGSWREGWAARLEAAQHQAVLGAAAAAEAGGECGAALRLHLDLLARTPLLETHAREAMRLYALLGEREAALELYRQLEAGLRHDLQLDPLPETQALAQQLRAGAPPDPRRSPLERSQAQLAHPPLVGREAVLDRLRAAPADLRLRLIVGEAGAGKTRLVQELIGQQPGGAVWLRGHPETQHTPFGVVAAALRGAARRGALRGLDPRWTPDLARLLPELWPDTPAAEALADLRPRFLEALVQALLHAAQGQSWVVLDDLHWLDAASLEVLLLAARRLRTDPRGTDPRPARPRLLATARRAELDARDDLRPLLAPLERDGHLERTTLDNLSELATLKLLRLLSGSSGATRLARRLHGATAGNPLWLLESLKSLLAGGQVQVDPAGVWQTFPGSEQADGEAGADLPLPHSLLDTVGAQLTQLDPGVRRLLGAASLLGEELQAAELAAALDLSELAALDGLEQAEHAGLLAARESGFVFRHELLRRAVEQTLNPQRRRWLHRQLAGALERLKAASLRVAEQRERGGLPCFDHWLQAADQARAVYAQREVLGCLAHALTHAPGPAERAQLWLERVEVWRTLNLSAEWHADLAAAEREAQASADPSLQLDVALRWVNYLWRTGDPERAVQLAEGMQHQPMSDEQRAKLADVWGAALRELKRFSEAQHVIQSGLHEGISLLTRANLHNDLAACAALSGRLLDGQEHIQLALEGFKAVQNIPGQIAARMTAFYLADELKQDALAEDHAQQAYQLARQIDHVRLLNGAIQNLMEWKANHADWVAVIELANEGLELCERTFDQGGILLFTEQLNVARAAHRP